VFYDSPRKTTYTRNVLTFVSTTAIAYGQKIGRSLLILVVCNSSCVHKRQGITSSVRSHSPLKLAFKDMNCIGTSYLHKEAEHR